MDSKAALRYDVNIIQAFGTHTYTQKYRYRRTTHAHLLAPNVEGRGGLIGSLLMSLYSSVRRDSGRLTPLFTSGP